MHDSNNNEPELTISTKHLQRALPFSKKKIIYQRQSARDEALREWKQKLEQQRQKEQQQRNKSKGCLQKCVQCFTKMFQCRGRQNVVGNAVQVKTEDLIQAIKNLRNEQPACTEAMLPRLQQNKKTLVLDLEGMLVFTSRNFIPNFNLKSRISSKAGNFTLYVKFRPGLLHFLDQVSQNYELVLFTSSPKEIVNVVLRSLGKRVFQHILYRDNCICLNQMYYLKDLRIMNRSLTTIISIDCNAATGVLQPQNFYQVSHYYGSDVDCELEEVSLFISWLHSKANIIPVSKHCQDYYSNHVQSGQNDQIDKTAGHQEPQIMLNMSRKLIKLKKNNQQEDPTSLEQKTIIFKQIKANEEHNKNFMFSNTSPICSDFKKDMKETNFTEMTETRTEKQAHYTSNNPYRVNISQGLNREISQFQIFRGKMKLRKIDSSSSSIMKEQQF